MAHTPHSPPSSVPGEGEEGAAPPPARREAIRRLVLDAGFDRVGFAEAGEARHADRLRSWLERGFAGGMDYIARSLERRADPRRVLPGALSVIAVALHHPGPGTAGRGRGRIAAYARGTDYHLVLERRLKKACAALRAAHPAAYRFYADTGPVLERDWAERAGIGWIGKNTCAIHPERGSYFFIGAILTTLDIEADSPSADHCGTCRACIDACPTRALVGPYQLDARLCISYLTIEHRGAIGEDLEPALGDLIFGCDICQEVCPYNRGERPGDPELAGREDNVSPALDELALLDEAGFRHWFAQSAVRRARFPGFIRNVAIALGNSAAAGAGRTLAALARRPEVTRDPVLRATVKRAIARRAEAAS